MDCDFCRELMGKNSYFQSLYWPTIKTRNIIGTPNFIVMPSIGQIVEGYLLIVSREHYTSIGLLPSEKIQELEELINKVRKLIISSYGKTPIFYEHGVPCEDGYEGGCGINHLHVHAVPLSNQTEILKTLSTGSNFRRISSITELGEIVTRSNPYLFIINEKGEKWVNEEDNFPSQYMRKVLANKNGASSWDWRAFGREELLIKTYYKLSRGIKLTNL